MFIWDWVASTVFDQILEWIYQQILEFLNQFFALMNGMGAELFELNWIRAIVLFVSYFGWAMYCIGVIVAVFDQAIAYQQGKANFTGTGINLIKGFMAASLFTSVPIALYKFCITLQSSLSSSIIGIGGSINTSASTAINLISNGGYGLAVSIFLLIMMGYAVIKVFFANLKRGGILLIQITIGSMYMFSIPRGMMDSFVGWCKQVIGLCITAFLQSTLLMIGLLITPSNILLGVGVMMASSEVPRITDRFGLDTSVKFNAMSTMFAVNSGVNLARTITHIAK